MYKAERFDPKIFGLKCRIIFFFFILHDTVVNYFIIPTNTTISYKCKLNFLLSGLEFGDGNYVYFF